MLVFEERGKPEYLEKNLSKQSREQQFQPWATLVWSERSHHCAIHAPPKNIYFLISDAIRTYVIRVRNKPGRDSPSPFSLAYPHFETSAPSTRYGYTVEVTVVYYNSI